MRVTAVPAGPRSGFYAPSAGAGVPFRVRRAALSPAFRRRRVDPPRRSAAGRVARRYSPGAPSRSRSNSDSWDEALRLEGQLGAFVWTGLRLSIAFAIGRGLAREETARTRNPPSRPR